MFFARPVLALCLAAFASGCSETGDTETDSATQAAFYNAPEVGRVLRIESGVNTDLVIINAGYARNVRPGMKLTLSRQGKAIASLVVAEATQDSAAALILDLTPNETVKAGDSAKVKTVSSLN